MRVIAFALAASIAAAASAIAAEPPATVTLLEGPAGLLRGTARFALAEGVRLQSGDIVEVAEKGLAQIEFGDGTIISLGPRSRFYAASIAAKGGVSDFYFMQGWSKLANAKPAMPFRYTTPLFGLAIAETTTVVQLSDSAGNLFVEAGEVRLAEGFGKASSASPVRLRGGDFYVRKADQKGVVQPRPAASFLDAMPRNYLDNLPVRVARFKEREVAPRRVEDLSYADVEMWLKGPAEIRRTIMQRFIAKADEPAFRHALIVNLRFHPEWDRILFPEKYKPKPPPESAPSPSVVSKPVPPAAAPAPAPAPAPAKGASQPEQPVTVEGVGSPHRPPPRNQ